MDKERKARLAAIWGATHKDFKGRIDGVRMIMVLRGGSCLVPLDVLTDEEIAQRLPRGFGA